MISANKAMPQLLSCCNSEESSIQIISYDTLAYIKKSLVDSRKLTFVHILTNKAFYFILDVNILNVYATEASRPMQ